MPKLVLSDLTSLTSEDSAVNAINSNSAATEAALEKTLSRDGTSPNEMNADLDMNGNDILNLPTAATPTSAVRKMDMESYVTNILGYTTGASPLAAANVSVAAAGDISSATVQAALQELDTEKLSRGKGPVTQIFTGSATYTRSAGCTSVDVMVMGGGGGGGGASGATSNAAIGGCAAAGGRAYKHISFTASVVTGATKANPCVVTITSNPFQNGDVITFSGILGMTELNGNSYTVANRTATTIELSGTNSVGYTTYISGGTAEIVSIPVTVGTAGTAGSSAAGNGGTGGTSSFNTYCSATGGAGGGGMAFGTTFLASTAGSGGVGSGGDLNVRGSGTKRQYRFDGLSLIACSSGGDSPYGDGALQQASNGTGLNAGGYGTGGSGGASTNSATSRAGGTGGPGLVLVQENFW